jgi:hypothetical protein
MQGLCEPTAAVVTGPGAQVGQLCSGTIACQVGLACLPSTGVPVGQGTCQLVAGSSANCTGGDVNQVDPTTGHCYSLFQSQPTNSPDARSRCASLVPSAHLVTISSVEENSFVQQIVGGNHRVWIGAGWLLGSWSWITGEPFTFTNWDVGEPNGSGPCADFVNGFWRDNDCGDNEPYLCERDSTSIH